MKLDPDASVVSAWTRVASKKKQELKLPMPFELPHNFQPNIQAGLDEQNLTGKARAKFITSIAEAMYRFKSYPTKEEFEHIASQMVKKWKFLETRTGHVCYRCRWYASHYAYIMIMWIHLYNYMLQVYTYS